MDTSNPNESLARQELLLPGFYCRGCRGPWRVACRTCRERGVEEGIGPGTEAAPTQPASPACSPFTAVDVPKERAAWMNLKQRII